MANPTSISSQEKPTCAICTENIYPASTISVPYCGHVYHKACLDKWLQNHVTCPIDREVIKAENSVSNSQLQLASLQQHLANLQLQLANLQLRVVSAQQRVVSGCGGSISQSSNRLVCGCGGSRSANPRPRGGCE